MKIRNYSVHRITEQLQEEAWVLDPNGKRRPRWVRKLFWWANSKLKIIAPKILTETVYRFAPVDLGNAKNAVLKAAISYLNRDWHEADLIVYMGPEQWFGVQRDMHFSGSFIVEEEFHRHGYAGRIVNIPVIVLPEIEGVLVVPRPRVLGR